MTSEDWGGLWEYVSTCFVASALSSRRAAQQLRMCLTLRDPTLLEMFSCEEMQIWQPWNILWFHFWLYEMCISRKMKLVCVGGWEGGRKTLPKWKCHFHVFKDLRFFFAFENNFHFKSFSHFISIGTLHPQRWKWHFSLHIKWNMSFKIKRDVSFCKLLTRRAWILVSQIYQWCWKAAWALILHYCSSLYVLEWLWPGPSHSTAMSWPGIHLRWLLSMVEVNESCLQSLEQRALVQNSVGQQEKTDPFSILGSHTCPTSSDFHASVPQSLLSSHQYLSLPSFHGKDALWHMALAQCRACPMKCITDWNE